MGRFFGGLSKRQIPLTSPRNSWLQSHATLPREGRSPLTEFGPFSGARNFPTRFPLKPSPARSVTPSPFFLRVRISVRNGFRPPRDSNDNEASVRKYLTRNGSQSRGVNAISFFFFPGIVAAWAEIRYRRYFYAKELSLIYMGNIYKAELHLKAINKTVTRAIRTRRMRESQLIILIGNPN